MHKHSDHGQNIYICMQIFQFIVIFTWQIDFEHVDCLAKDFHCVCVSEEVYENKWPV